MNYGVVVPDWVRANMEREKTLERTGYQARVLKRLLKDLDPRLDLVWVKENAPPLPGLQPGRWHVQRKNPGAPDSYFPITQADGGYMEPHAGIIEQLKQADLSRVDIAQHLSTKRDREAKAAEKKKALEKEQRRDHIAEDYRAARRVAGESIHRKRWAAG